MLMFNFTINNPWSNRFQNIKCWSGPTFLENIFWEVQIAKTSNIIGFAFQLRWRRDHPGVAAAVSLLGYEIGFDIYDHRHLFSYQ